MSLLRTLFALVVFGSGCLLLSQPVLQTPTEKYPHDFPVPTFPSLLHNLKLKQQIDSVLRSVDAIVGVSAELVERAESLEFNNDQHYPMQSVYKLPLAAHVLSLVDAKHLKLDSLISIRKQDWKRDTWSPLAERCAYKSTKLSIDTVLRSMVSESDNNACDILFRLLGGPRQVERYMHSQGITRVHIRATEDQMHRGDKAQYTNWCEAQAMTLLLRKLHQQTLLSASSTTLLLRYLTETSNPANRIVAGLPEGTAVAHKTGTSGTVKGRIVALNDVGIIRLPNGQHLILSVYVHHSALSYDASAKCIADITKLIYNACTQ